MLNTAGRRTMPKHTIYTIEDKHGRIHQVKVPEDPTRVEKFSRFVQKIFWRLLSAGFFFFLGYLIGMASG